MLRIVEIPLKARDSFWLFLFLMLRQVSAIMYTIKFWNIITMLTCLPAKLNLPAVPKNVMDDQMLA